MSLLTTVENLIKSYKVQQAEINGKIQLYKQLLLSVVPQEEECFQKSEATSDAAIGENTLQRETEDIDLLERMLKKALQVRTGTEPSEKNPSRNKLSGPQIEPVGSSMGVSQSCADKGSQKTVKLTSKTSSIPMKGQRKAGPSICFTLDSGPSSSSSYNPGQSKPSKNRHMSQKDSVLPASSIFQGAVSHTDESGSFILPQQNGVCSEQMTKWKSLKNKQNRLWDKVIAQQRKLVPGRSRFMERMRATFPMEWPCGSPNETRALVDRLTQQGHDLTIQTSKTTLKLGGKTNRQNPSWACEGLKQGAEELNGLIDQVQQEWKAWDRWRPEGGCLCTTGANGVLEDGIAPLLPLTMTYTSKKELQELEWLRMRVVLLQQEISLEESLLDCLSYQISSIHPGLGCPNPSELRGLYSLLGEGGERFPAIVLDFEPD